MATRRILALILVTAFATAHAHDAVPMVSITTDQNYRYIKSNGIPETHGQFPNEHNPSTISAQNYNFRVPLNPQFASYITQLQGNTDFGVGLNGVPFDPGTAEFWNGDPQWRYEALLTNGMNLGMDQNNAHVQPSGAYHYHGLPTDLMAGQSSSKHSNLIGYAADGFPIYAKYGYVQADNPNSGIKELQSSYKLRSGERMYGHGPSGPYDGSFAQDYEYIAGAGDLDECNGRSGVTPDYPNGTYYYFITTNFPIVPRCFKGTPDNSFVKNEGRGPGGGGNRRPMGPPPPPPRGY